MSIASYEESDVASWDEEETTAYRPFFVETPCATPLEALRLDMDATDGELDILTLIRDLDLDSYEVIRLLNYFRSLEGDVQKGLEFVRELRAQRKAHSLWRDEAYLIPTDPEDALLTVDFEELCGQQLGLCRGGAADVEHLQQEVTKLRQEVEWLKTGPEGRDGIHSVLAEERDGTIPFVTQERPILCAASDRAYFQSYSSESVHREMLADKVRMEGYSQAIEQSGDLFRGKTVLDVGCGTGILSLMACRAGARFVYAVEGSDWAASVAESIVRENGFEERIKVLHGKVEELDDQIAAVDIIISEWMGYALLFESMLDSVLYSRDRWLKPDGEMLPNSACLFIAGGSEAALDTAFWKDVYGFSMRSLAAGVIEKAQKIPLVHAVEPDHLVTKPFRLQAFDLQKMKAQEAGFTADFCLSPVSEVWAVVLWFAVRFPHTSVSIDTSPHSSLTHWAQTVLALKYPVGGPLLKGHVSFSRELSSRSLSISLHCLGGDRAPQTMVYTLDVLS